MILINLAKSINVQHFESTLNVFSCFVIVSNSQYEINKLIKYKTLIAYSILQADYKDVGYSSKHCS